MRFFPIKMPGIFVGLFLVSYALLIGPFSAYMAAKPIEEKLGYVPPAQVIRLFSAGMKESSGAGLVMKVMMYFGGVTDENSKKVSTEVDVEGMSRMLQGAVELDPYNMDAYYFSQAFLVWDAKQIEVANDMLDHGMKYRTWDWYLPFFAGFNNAYFLKDFDKAAAYYKRAADLTGDRMFVGLAGRYMQQAGKTALAIVYLKGMLATAHDELTKKTFATRLKAFEEVQKIEEARDQFLAVMGRLPKDIDELLQAGILTHRPYDPYGGTFYLQPDGKVLSTSKFAFIPSSKKESVKP